MLKRHDLVKLGWRKKKRTSEQPYCPGCTKCYYCKDGIALLVRYDDSVVFCYPNSYVDIIDEQHLTDLVAILNRQK